MAMFINRNRALVVAAKKLIFKRDKEIETMCDFAGMTVADAYKCGAEEAQSEIINRLALIVPLSLGGTTAKPKDNAIRVSPPTTLKP